MDPTNWGNTHHQNQQSSTKRDTLLSVLHSVQSPQRGKTWITDKDLSSIAREYKIPIAELDGIVSFYTLFSRAPRGRHVIRSVIPSVVESVDPSISIATFGRGLGFLAG